MCKTSAELFVEAQAQYNAFSFYKKLGFNNMVRNMGGTTSTVSLEMDGYLFSNAGKSVVLGDGDYYVYVWKHAWGEPFYVGSGRGDRWITKAPRNPQFYYHLDNADAAVYKVVSGMNEETARMCEAYVSLNFSAAGFPLTNGDNVLREKDDETIERRLKKYKKIEELPEIGKIQAVLLNLVLENERYADYRKSQKFIEEYGKNYFSNKYCKGA